MTSPRLVLLGDRLIRWLMFVSAVAFSMAVLINTMLMVTPLMQWNAAVPAFIKTLLADDDISQFAMYVQLTSVAMILAGGAARMLMMSKSKRKSNNHSS